MLELFFDFIEENSYIKFDLEGEVSSLGKSQETTSKMLCFYKHFISI